MGAQWETGDRVAAEVRGDIIAGVIRFAGPYASVGVPAAATTARVGICEWGYHVRLTDTGRGRVFYGVIDQDDGATAWGSRLEAEAIAAEINGVHVLERYGPAGGASSRAYTCEGARR